MYIIWHDNDFDLALWVYQNSCLKDKEKVILRQIPKTNNETLLSSDFTDKTDYLILPYIKFATPDILVQRVNEDGTSKVLVATEFMTHTPQHDHVFQRFERIFCIAREKVPVACILPSRKVKIERGKKSAYYIKNYQPNPLVVHLYLKTTLINKSPALMFFWPEKDGYLKFDNQHQTAPKIEAEIENWFKFFNSCVNEEPNILDSDAVKKQYEYLDKKFPLNDDLFANMTFDDYVEGLDGFYSLARIAVMDTAAAISKFKLDETVLPKTFKHNKKTVILAYASVGFRTDPYAGFLCGFKNLLCLNNDGQLKNNLLLVPIGIKYSLVSKSKTGRPTFTDLQENLLECPIDKHTNFERVGIDASIKHVEKGCIYARSKHQRIFGTVADAIIFEDYIYYNKNYVR